MKRIPTLHEVDTRIIDDKTDTLLPLSSQEQKKFEYYENLHVELSVIMYGRVCDHLGYNHQILEKVSLIQKYLREHLPGVREMGDVRESLLTVPNYTIFFFGTRAEEVFGRMVEQTDTG